MADTSNSTNLGANNHMDQTAYDLLKTLQQHGTGCPICHLVHRGVVNYLDGISYENVNDLDVRQELRTSLGYCAAHGQIWLHLHDSLGTAIIYSDVIAHILEVLQHYASPTPAAQSDKVNPDSSTSTGTDTNSGNNTNTGVYIDTTGRGMMKKLHKLIGNGRATSSIGRTLAAELEPGAPCPVCLYTMEREKDMAHSFAEGLTHNDFAQAYQNHETGLCLPHFRQVLRAARKPVVKILVLVQQAKLETTLTDLSEVARKNDYRYKSEPRGDEFKAPARSVKQVAGDLPTQLNWPHGHSQP